jgi:hypothetical protein
MPSIPTAFRASARPKQTASAAALIVEFDAHDGLWMFTNVGVFFNSMDYLDRPESYTPSRTATDRNGRIRLVMAHRDPNVHNWLGTQGFGRGNLTYHRHMLEGEPAVLATEWSSSTNWSALSRPTPPW